MTSLALIGRIILLALERIIVKKLGQGNDSIEVTVIFFGIGAAFLFPFVLTSEISSYSFIPYALASSFIYSLTFVLYVRALSQGDVSLVTPIASFNVLFLFLLSTIFLQESFTLLKLAGIFLIFYGSSYLKPGSNLIQSVNGIIKDKPCFFMLISTLLLAVGRTIDKAASPDVSPLIYSFVIYLAITLILVIYLIYRKRVTNIIHIFRKKPWISTISGAINAFSYLLLLVALKKIEVSIAVPLTMLSSLIAVVMGKYIFREQIKQRFIAATIIVIGSWFLLI